MKTYETPRGHTVVDPPPRRGNFTSHPPAGVMRLPREWRRSESVSDSGRYVEYRYVFPSVCLGRLSALCVAHNLGLGTGSGVDVGS
jgi:hypothetical protein